MNIKRLLFRFRDDGLCRLDGRFHIDRDDGSFDDGEILQIRVGGGRLARVGGWRDGNRQRRDFRRNEDIEGEPFGAQRR